MVADIRPPAFDLDPPPHVLIVLARTHDAVADALLQGARAELERAHAGCEVIAVDTPLEIAPAIACALKALDFDPMRRRSEGYLALGGLVRRHMPMADIVFQECVHSLQRMAGQFSLAVGTGLAVHDTVEQALQDAATDGQDAGGAAIRACLRMIAIKHQLKLMPKRRWVAQ